jgi:monoamine oxidase
MAPRTLAIITSGQSITDQPIRQCYYWAKDEKTQNAVVLIYDDGTDLDFWAGLRGRETIPPSSSDAPDPWEEHKAPPLMIAEAHRQLLLMHGVQNRSDIPKPSSAAYRDWGEDPFGGGANFWHVNVNSNDVFQNILQPKPPIPVYICGEAYSQDQGWVEGPLATADAMLERHFGLGPPAWLKSG